MVEEVKDGEKPAADNQEAESGAQAQGDGDPAPASEGETTE